MGDSWFGRDKVMHFVTSFSTTLWGYPFARYQLSWDRDASMGFSCTFALSTGVVKEITDALRSGEMRYFSYKDLVWDIAGVGAAFLILSIFLL